MSELTQALQNALAAEHDAVYVLATLGARTPRSTEPAQAQLLRDLYDAHEQRRDWLHTHLADAGQVPTPAAAAYALPAVTDVISIAQAAVALESPCLEHYSWLIELGDAEVRAWALAALRQGAVAQALLTGAVSAFPGAPELINGLETDVP